jgi:hypothetical protein
VSDSAEHIVWITQTGFRCVARRYDDKRYQLRLTWGDGTVKTDLFHSYETALAAASAWKSDIQAREEADS